MMFNKNTDQTLNNIEFNLADIPKRATNLGPSWVFEGQK